MADKATIHRNVSYLKSVLRLIGYTELLFNVTAAVIILFLSEVLGIVEEVAGS